jgi:hypothetical protein
MKQNAQSRLFHAVFAVLLGSFSGCVYTKVTLPLDTDVNQTELGSKVGRASVRSVLGAVAWGDAGTKAAAENGNITTIRHLDQEQLVVLFGAYARYTTLCYGD